MRRPISPSGSPASRGSATRSSTRATRRRSWPAWAAAASPRTSSTGRSARIEGYLDAADPRLDRSGLRRRRRSTTSTRSGRSSSSPRSRARRPSRTRSWRTPGHAPRRALEAVPHHRYEGPGAYFAAITDPGRSAEAIAHHDDFREVFLNPPDIGGRYSALTYVGLVPASLHRDRPRRAARLGLGDARRLSRAGPGDQPGPVARAGDRDAGQGGPRQADLPGRRRDRRVRGVGRAAHRREHRQARRRDRARSTSSRSARSRPTARTGRSSGSRWPARTADARDALAAALEAGAGHPVIRIELADPIDLGAEFVRWEVATAIAGAVLGHRPVRPAERRGGQAADARRCSSVPVGDGRDRDGDGRRRRRADRERRRPGPVRRRGAAAHRPATATSSASWRATSPAAARMPTCASRRSSPRRPERDEAFARIRALLRDRTGRATTAGYGPRFLHSTGQLHKGGPPIGWFLQLTADHPADVEIPGWPYTFGQLIDAQAAGDFAAIESHDLPILRVHLGADPDAGLAALERALAAALDQHGGLTRCASGSSGSGGWAPTWSAAWSATATRSSSTTGRRRRPARSPGEGATPSFSIAELVAALEKPRAVWVMVPAGDATEAQIAELLEHLEPGDTIIDGGNTNFHDDVAAPRGARGEGHPLRRRRDVGRDLGPPGRLLPDGRRRRRGRRAARPDLHDARARRAATSTSAARAPATT